MAFVQVMKFQTDRMEEGRELVEEYRAATEGRRTSRRSILCRDRDNPDHYVNIVFFDSYESAMENSMLPETQALSQKLDEMTTGPTEFLNLDVEWDQMD